MKKLILIFTLLFSTVMFSSTSFAEWMLMGKNNLGKFYLDFERINKRDGYVYYWTLGDYNKQTKDGISSHKNYRQGDCKLFRFKFISASLHKKNMGAGDGIVMNFPEANRTWINPDPKSTNGIILNTVCSR